MTDEHPGVACASCGHTDSLTVKLTMWPDDPKPVSRVLCRGAMACNTRAGRLRATKATP